MTPDLMQEGEQRLASYQQREAALRTESGGRNASCLLYTSPSPRD